MDVFLIISACFFFILGFIGCILPFLPGTPLCYVAIILLQFTTKIDFSSNFLIFWLVLVVLLSLLDYYLPVWGTKRFGGSRWGVIGSTIGLVLGLFFMPWGIIFGPFAGAVLGELLAGKSQKSAFKAGIGSFVGFLFGTLAKFVVAGFLIFYGVQAFTQFYF